METADITTKSYMTREELLKFLSNNRNKKGKQIYIYANTFLYTETPNKEEEKGGRGYSGFGTNIPVSQKIALDFVDRLVPEGLAKKGVRISVTVCGHCIFIG